MKEPSTIHGPVTSLEGLRVVDLTRRLDPQSEQRRCEVRCRHTEYHGHKSFMSDIDIMSHLGTHLEFPMHWRDTWKDGTDYPVSHFVGRGVLLSLDWIKPNAFVSHDDLERAAEGRVKQGDTVLLNSPHRCEPFTFLDDDPRPNLGEEAARWCVEREIKCLGFGDAVAIENNVPGSNVMHEELFPRDILMLEVIENLDDLTQNVFFISYTPIPIVGADSFPVRAVAIEGLPEFSE